MLWLQLISGSLVFSVMHCKPPFLELIAGDISASQLSLELSMPAATCGLGIEQAVAMLINTRPSSGQPFVCFVTATRAAYSPTSRRLFFGSQHPLRQNVWSRRLKRKSYYVGLWVKAQM